MSTLESIDRGLKLLRSQEEERFPISGSTIGTCKRALAMQASGVEKRDLSSRALRIFQMGDISENVLVNARVLGDERFEGESGGGPHIACNPQRPVWTDLPGNFQGYNPREFEKAGSLRFSTRGQLQIRSRIDLLITVGDGHGGITASIEEYKSTADYSYKRILEDGPDDGYIAQVMCQAAGLEYEGMTIGDVSVIYQNKSDSSLTRFQIDTTSKKNRAILEARLEATAEAVLAWLQGNPNAVHGEYAELFTAKTGKLPWQCDYCMVGPKAGGCLDHRSDIRLVAKPKGDMETWYVAPAI